MDPVILNKTADGEFWTLDGWMDKEWVARLRFNHTTSDEPSLVQAEVGLRTDPTAPYGESMLWRPIGQPFYLALDPRKYEPDVWWARDFPSMHRAAFVELGRLLRSIGLHVDLGYVSGQLRYSVKRKDC